MITMLISIGTASNETVAAPTSMAVLTENNVGEGSDRRSNNRRLFDCQIEV